VSVLPLTMQIDDDLSRLEGDRPVLYFLFVSFLSLTRLRMQHEDEVVRLEREREEN
jgi:hypothetical protein